MKLKNNKHIPLDKFIDLSLYHPQKGFYMKKNPIGKKGDFFINLDNQPKCLRSNHPNIRVGLKITQSISLSITNFSCNFFVWL